MYIGFRVRELKLCYHMMDTYIYIYIGFSVEELNLSYHKTGRNGVWGLGVRTGT